MSEHAFKPGIYPAMSPDEYHADPHSPEPAMSSSLAKLMVNRSPLHAWTASARLNPAAEHRTSDAFDFGSTVHTLALGRGADIAVFDGADWRGKAAQTFCEEARAAGLIPMLAEQFDRASVAAARIAAEAAPLGFRPTRGMTEIAAFAVIDNVWCRALVDYAPDDPRLPLWDVKTTEDASPDAVRRSVESYGYAMQAAWYQDVWQAATGESRRRAFRFLFVEKNPPHEISVVELTDDKTSEADWMTTARDQCAAARTLWRHCLDTGRWPGYPRLIAEIGARPFAAQRWADSDARVSAATLRAAHAAQAPQ